MRRSFILGLAAISMLGAAGTSAILRCGGEPALSLPSAPASPAGVASALAPAAPAASPEAAAREVPTGDRWGGDRPAWRGRDAYQALRPFAERIAACARGDAPGRGATRLLLRLERMKDRLRVVGAEAPPGSPNAEALERCARAEIVGREIAMQGATPGPATTLLIPIRS
ncbi:MAG: hypothetical protein HZB56_17465 [Deltaproteobacteria bacterium]|nr:hypothetical protein [Deltaproteobacteria bacterium]